MSMARMKSDLSRLPARLGRAFEYARKAARRCVLYPHAWLIRRLRGHSVTVVGITGSAGKTTTKDLCQTILSEFGPCQSNPRSENEHFDIAQTITNVGRRHRFCVLELSGGRPGYLDFALRLSRPDIAVLTLIARDHFSAFKSLEAIAHEKGKIVSSLPERGIAVLNMDDPLVRQIGESCSRSVLWVGKSEGATLRLREARSRWPEPLTLTVDYEGRTYDISTALHGTHLALSALMSLGVAVAMNLPISSAIQALRSAAPPEGRMQVLTLENGITFVRDDWKAPLWSLQAPFDFMKDAQARRKVLIVGTLSDYSASASKVYPKVAREALEIGDLVVFVGPHAMRALKAPIVRAEQELLAFPSAREASAYLRTALRAGDLVLLKGSNKADHLVRLLLDQERRVHCWKEKCGLAMFCARCPVVYAGAPPEDHGVEFLRRADEVLRAGELENPSATEGPFVIVGLGNPGAEYCDTPHNVGYRVLDRLAARVGGAWETHKEGAVSLGHYGGTALALFKPGLYMNRSGEALRLFLERVGGSPERCTIIHDDIDLPLGDVRIKRNGGDAGHLGVRSIIGCLGTGEFERIRVGVRTAGDAQKAKERVLKRFSPDETDVINGSIAQAAEIAVARVVDLADSSKSLLA